MYFWIFLKMVTPTPVGPGHFRLSCMGPALLGAWLPLLMSFRPRAGLVIPRQTFVRRCRGAGKFPDHAGGPGARRRSGSTKCRPRTFFARRGGGPIPDPPPLANSGVSGA